MTRDPNPHLAFRHGVHFCLGAAFCPKCGKELAGDARFGPSCGATQN